MAPALSAEKHRIVICEPTLSPRYREPPVDHEGAPVAAAGRLAEGVELVGEYQGSGYVEPPYLIRLGGGRMVGVSPLLYQVAASLDGAADLADLARRVSYLAGRHIDEGGLRYIIDEKLRPLGVVASGAEPRRSGPPSPLLGLTVRTGVLPTRVVGAMTVALRPLFLPAAVVAVLLGLPAVDAWLLAGHGLTTGLGQMLYQPTFLLMFVAMTILGGCFHELGHATASRYGGAKPGVIGVGIYLIWPVFYNDLNDSYRLSRNDRLRADLGGVYFNVVFILMTAGLYGLTGVKPLLVVIAAQHLAIVQQFLPFLRLDGYYLVSDAAGVPDLFGRIRPTLAGLFRIRRAETGANELKPRARAIVTLWVLVSVPLMAGALVVLAMSVPRLVATGRASGAHEVAGLLAAVRAGAPVAGTVSGLKLAALVIPLAGLTVVLVRVLHAGSASVLRCLAESGHFGDTLRHRWVLGTVVALNLAVAVGAAVALRSDRGPSKAVVEVLDAQRALAPPAATPVAGTPDDAGAARPSTVAPRSTHSAGAAPPATAAAVTPESPAPPVLDPAPSAVMARAQPSNAQIAAVIEQFRRRMPLFQPTAAQVSQFGDRICTAFDQQASFGQVSAGVISASHKVPLMTVSPADAAAAVRSAVTLFCPGHLAEFP